MTKISDALDTGKVRLVYDANFNLVFMREFPRTAKLGDEVVRVTKYVYDANFNLIKILSAYKTEAVTSDDLGS